MADEHQRAEGRGRGRPIKLQAETEQAAELAMWLQQVTKGWYARRLAERFPYSETKRADFRWGKELILDWLLEQVVQALVREPQLRRLELAKGRALLEAAEKAAARKLPAQVRHLPATDLQARLEKAQHGQEEVLQTLNHAMVLLLVLMNAQRQLTEEYEALEEQARRDQHHIYQLRLDLAREHLRQARAVREKAEDTHLASHARAELYRRLLRQDDRKSLPLEHAPAFGWLRAAVVRPYGAGRRADSCRYWAGRSSSLLPWGSCSGPGGGERGADFGGGRHRQRRPVRADRGPVTRGRREIVEECVHHR
ncbi:hypothetical protein [Streptomyces niger]|uniref:hypothetical protein n=1 Tax=Streptomyces niger TaxID=66373 RepID=UPI0018FE98AC|nr:hypothetical protein [Streptomyces niger]